MVGRLLPEELAAVALGRISRTAVTMSRRSFLVSESVLRRLLEAGLEDDDAVEGVFLFLLHLEVMDVDVTTGGGLSRVVRLRPVETLIICLLLMCYCNFCQPRGTVHAFLFLLVPLCGLILLLMVIAYTTSQAAIIFTLTLFNRLNFIFTCMSL